jgi:hypothetical protein
MAESAEHDSNGNEATDRVAAGAGHPPGSLSRCGDRARARTADLGLRRALLFPLSYATIFHGMETRAGIEPA